MVFGLHLPLFVGLGGRFVFGLEQLPLDAHDGLSYVLGLIILIRETRPVFTLPLMAMTREW